MQDVSNKTDTLKYHDMKYEKRILRFNRKVSRFMVTANVSVMEVSIGRNKVLSNKELVD